MLLFLIVLAIVQGATEFLPISSSGHLVLLYNIFGMKSGKLLISVILHLATLFSVIIYYRRDIVKLLTKPFCKTNINIVITSIITATIALILKKHIEAAFDGSMLYIGFAVTAVLLMIAQFCPSKVSTGNIRDMNISPIQAIVIGTAQGLACFPALSRSGTTIASSLMIGVPREEATKYSFLISLPIILASNVLEIIEFCGSAEIMPCSIIEIFVAFVIALVVGLLSIHICTLCVNKQKLYYFSFYLILLSLLLVLNSKFMWF